MKIEKATIHDSGILTEITMKSKAYWGYSEEQIMEWNNFLTISIDYIEKNTVIAPESTTDEMSEFWYWD